MHVLIIDDDLGIRGTLGTALETMGHHVETATSRTAAEKKLRNGSFEVAFLLHPAGSRERVGSSARSSPAFPRLAVVVITAYSSI